MTAYWDSQSSRVRDLSEQHKGDLDAFVAAVTALERQIISTVSLTVGDREFPVDLRERILRCIALKAVQPIEALPANEEPLWSLKACKYSELVTELHSIFHDVARRRPPSRFGSFSDDPSGALRLREAWEQENA